jgi:hypothetical protein
LAPATPRSISSQLSKPTSVDVDRPGARLHREGERVAQPDAQIARATPVCPA